MITGIINPNNTIKISEGIQYHIIDKTVYNITTLKVYQFEFFYEREVYQQINEWALSEVGLWVRKHAVCPIKYHSFIKVNSVVNHHCSLVTSMFAEHATYFHLKWSNYETFNSK